MKVDNIPAIISAAAQSNLGVLALLVIALSLLAYFFFARATVKVKVGIFILLFIGVVGFGITMFRAASVTSGSKTQPSTPPASSIAPPSTTAVPTKSTDDGTGNNASQPIEYKPVFLRIKSVKLFPPDPDAEIQLLIYVNGTQYRHPSVGGVNWMKVGPSMSEKLIELPKDRAYVIHFEMMRRGRPTLEGNRNIQYVKPSYRATSQLFSNIDVLPHEEEYKLYDVNGNTRSASVSATVDYRISEGGK